MDLNDNWTLTSVEVTKDMTIRWYENDDGIRKKEVEVYKYSQYRSYLHKKVVLYYDSEGNETDSSGIPIEAILWDGNELVGHRG